ncbi:MAG: glycosyltransferase family 39 protein [Saprospiraceae bacterium]|nr:glycosyltransferase family 39 protein [Saprospiraceae bacterium]
MDKQAVRYSLLFTGLGALFFVSFLGGVHLFDWDEVNFAEISREMILTGEYTRVYVDFHPFWEKPPFFFWSQVTAMKLFGVNEFSARLPNALCGIATLVLLYNFGRKLYDHRFGVIWAGVYMGTVLPFLYFKSGIIDPILNLFIFLGLYYFILFYWKKDSFKGIELSKNKWVYLFWSGFFIGMGILTKGQVAYMIAALTFFVYWVYQRFRFYVNVPEFLFFTVAATLVTFTWYGIETAKNGTWFIEEFNRYQYRLFSTPDAGHRGFPGYHFIVLLVGCFPASIFAIRSFFNLPTDEYDYQKDFRRWMKYLFWVVLILFTIVKSKIVHYSSMCYFPLSFLASVVIYHLIAGKLTLNRWMKGGLIGIGGLFILATVALPFLAMNIELIEPLFSKDPFAKANLEAAVNWNGTEILPGLLLLTLLILFLRWEKQQAERAYKFLFGGTALFVFLTLIFFIKRIEGYSQRAAVDFFVEVSDENAYVMTHGYKSYVDLFYFNKARDNDPSFDTREEKRDWFLTGPIDKDVYIVTKINKTKELVALPDVEEIGRKNGFVFYKRSKKTDDPSN